jgi:ubiquinone biosynthesis protein UbiJ
VFWLVIALAVIAVAGFAVQTERVRELQSRNATLEGELFSTRSALAAYADRFDVVRDTVAGLNAQLERLSSLVSEDPVPDSPPPVAD